MLPRSTLRLAAAIVLAMTSPALAQQADEASLLHQGFEMLRQHHDKDAARIFQQAYDVSHSPNAAAQLGAAEQALGRWIDAERHVREALAARNDAWVVHHHEALDQAMTVIQRHVGTLDVTGSPAGAEVSAGRSAASS